VAEQIKDGTGKGFLLKIDSGNHLQAVAITETDQHHVSKEDKKAFVANTADTANTLTITATGGSILYIRNDSTDDDMTIADFVISVDTAGIVCRIIRQPTLGSIGNNNVHVPKNANFGSSLTAEGTFHNWDEVGDGLTGLTAGTVYSTLTLPVGVTRVHPNGEVVLQSGNAVSLELIGACEAAAYIAFFYEEAD